MDSEISNHSSFLNKSYNHVMNIYDKFENLLMNRSFFSVNIMTNKNIKYIDNIIVEKLKTINTKLKGLIFIQMDLIIELHDLFNYIFTYYSNMGVDLNNRNDGDILIYKPLKLFYKYYIHGLYFKINTLKYTIIPKINEIYDSIGIIIKQDVIKNDTLVYEKCIKIYNKKYQNPINDEFMEIFTKINDCLDILSILQNKNQIINYYKNRCSLSQNLCNKIKDEFFVIAYRPDIFQKIILDERENTYIKNNFS